MPQAANRTRRSNPDQLAFAGEYRGYLKRKRPDPTSGNPNPPDYEGACTLNGENYYISGWIDRKGTPSLKLVFQFAMRGDRTVGPYQLLPDDLRLDKKFGKTPPY